MSSMLRAYSQIPVREKYLLAATDGSANAVSAFELTPGAYINVTSVATLAEVTDPSNGYANVGATILAGQLFKDLGRQITIYDPADHKHLSVYRQVQLVNGVGTEGVCNAADYCANIFVKVWSADGLGVVVVRTG